MLNNFSPPAGSENLLLVEGRDDGFVVSRLRDRLAPELEFAIDAKGGWNVLQDSIPDETMAPGRRSLGILVDADTSVQGRWQAIRGALQSSELDMPVPTALSRRGTIIDAEIRIGVWLMPDNMHRGEIEDFIVPMIPAGDRVWPLAQQYIDGIPETDRKFRNRKILKAQLHAWLAARREPRQIGSAIERGDLIVDGPLCQTFADWLKALFQ